MWNDKETAIDLLGHRRIAQTIVEIIREEELRPLTIGIHGNWGAGKTSVLSLIEAEFAADEKTLCFTFNGWLYEGYQDTKSALMEAVVHQLMAKRSVSTQVVDLGKSLLKRINWLKTAKVAGSLALNVATGFSWAAIAGLPELLSITKTVLGKKEDKDSATSIDVLEAAKDDEWLKPEEATVPAQIQAFRNELKQLIKASTVERLVILVDDLDRCLPAAVIDVLEAIKLFLFVEGTVFVIAADEQMIEYAVRRHFPELPVSQAEYTKHYLEKLIQIPIRVPSLNQLQTQNYIRFLLLQNFLLPDKQLITEICTAFETSRQTPYDNKELSFEFVASQLTFPCHDLQPVLRIADQLGSTLAKELRGNPRNIKRFLNTLFLRHRVAKIYGLEQRVELRVLAKLMLIERFYPETYEQIVNEVVEAEDGRSPLVLGLEEKDENEEQKSKAGKRKGIASENTSEEELREWGKLEPPLSTLDLKPYIFISRERAVSFKASDDLPHALVPVYEALVGGHRIAIAKYEPELRALDPTQARQLFNALKKLVLKSGNWRTLPKPLEGLFYLVQRQPSLELPLVELISSVAVTDLGIGVISNLTSIKTPEGKKAIKILYENIEQNPDADSKVKELIKQLIPTLPDGNFH
ncbi:KAP family P-loop domain protein [Nibrella viscosa]|uniref:KAP family P-loop domain protein n=1 Tax=Nibrella viscosa TaxID=1084524 RepID=A0ABP8L0X2_9BACT